MAELAQVREQLRKARLGIGLEVEQARLAELAQRQYKHPVTVTNAIARAEADLARIMRDMDEVLLATTPQEIGRASCRERVLPTV